VLQFIFKKLDLSFENYFKPIYLLNQSLVSNAKWHITSPVYRHCIKSYYLKQYRLILFTNIRNVSKTKHNLIFV